MEELTKTQLILLALLVSFVTSIATGIATVALIEQAPSDVTRVINKVVERTVERVVPSQGAGVVTTEKTIVVREEDVIADSIAKVHDSIVRLTAADALGKEVFLGMGIVARADGLVVTDSALVSDETIYTAGLADGTTFKVRTVLQNEKRGIALMEMLSDETSNTDVGTKSTFKPAAVTFGDVMTLKLGQTVIALSRKNVDSVTTGIVASLIWDEPTSVDKTEKNAEVAAADVSLKKRQLVQIQTDLNINTYTAGAPLINLFGEVIGIALYNKAGAFLPIDVVLAFISTLEKGDLADGALPKVETES